jgi:hypothetical protein
MPRRPCLGCGTLTDRADSRCPGCASARERERGSRHERGYGNDYVKARDRAVTGATHCRTCGNPFAENNPATGGHVVAVRHGGTAADGIEPECRKCNYGWQRTGN